MGNYVFSADLLVEAVTTDADDQASKHDLGGDIIPMLVERGEACVWDFAESDVPGTTERDRAYWRDVGTLDAYYDAHMDLISVEPIFNLYNEEWPILTWHEPLPPAKFVFDEPGRVGQALNSLVCSGVVVSGGTVRRSILSPGVRIHSHAEVTGTVLMHGVDVGRGAIVRNAIVDKNVRIEPGAHGRRRPRGRPQALRRLGRRRRRRRQGRHGRGLMRARRAADARVPAGRLRRRGRARRVPRARAREARRRDRPLLGRRRGPASDRR